MPTPTIVQLRISTCPRSTLVPAVLARSLASKLKQGLTVFYHPRTRFRLNIPNTLYCMEFRFYTTVLSLSSTLIASILLTSLTARSIPFMILYTLYIYAAMSNLFVAYYIFYKTKKGLEICSIGENPKSADVVGIDVFKYRFLSTIVGAMFLGIAGAYLPLILTGSYSFKLTAGRGYMAIGIAIFANWRPQRIFLSSFIFVTFEVMAPQLQIFFPSLPYEFFLFCFYLPAFWLSWLFFESASSFLRRRGNHTAENSLKVIVLSSRQIKGITVCHC